MARAPTLKESEPGARRLPSACGNQPQSEREADTFRTPNMHGLAGRVFRLHDKARKNAQAGQRAGPG